MRTALKTLRPRTRSLKTLAALAQPGDYVLARFRNLSRQGSSEIPDSVKTILRDLGSSLIESLTRTETTG